MLVGDFPTAFRPIADAADFRFAGGMKWRGHFWYLAVIAGSASLLWAVPALDFTLHDRRRVWTAGPFWDHNYAYSFALSVFWIWCVGLAISEGRGREWINLVSAPFALALPAFVLFGLIRLVFYGI
jgi:hypothetical protein